VAEASLLIKKVPSDLKEWLAAEALRNHRSMNKEAIRLLEEARHLRDKTGNPARDAQSIAGILRAMHALPVLDKRPMDEVLYDASGLPQ
jgi:hypothetical protein